MPYLDAVIQENLRMFTPVSENNRMCTKECTLKGMKIKPGTRIQMPTFASHYNPNFFRNPEMFKPERFLKENAGSIIPFTMRPFGGGPRICIGQRFALTEIKICLAKILKNYRLEMTEETVLKNWTGDLFFFGFEEMKVKFCPRN